MLVDVLGVDIAALSLAEAVSMIEEFVAQGVPRRVVTANPELLYRACRDIELRELINSADLVTADGEGIVWAAGFLGTPVPQRVTGIDLLQSLLPKADLLRWRIFFLGAAPGVAAEALAQVSREYPGIIPASHHGFFRPGEEEEEVLEGIRRFRPHLLLVGLGAPRQERWIFAHCRELGVPVSIGVGGSFDVLSGRVKRAPLWVRRLRLEWLARLLRQPSRWKRQTALPKFAAKILQQKFTQNPRKN